MTEKQKRHQKILELIGAQAIEKQDALSAALGAVGVSTTQSTLSKDMKELGVVKVPDGSGGFRYRGGQIFLQNQDLLQRELTDFVVGLDGVEHTLVVKTITGHAQGVCEAMDQAGWTEVVGTVAGENTIFILCRSTEDRLRLQDHIRGITGAL